jgi:CheY-like chemotaxis protein
MKRVLIIDDDDGVREVAQMSLQLVAGWEVQTAASGRDGIAAARDMHPDGIVLDVMMPGLDGPETLAELRRDPAVGATPVVFLTAKVQQTERSSLEALDASGIIVKPFDPMHLHELVATTFGW